MSAPKLIVIALIGLLGAVPQVLANEAAVPGSLAEDGIEREELAADWLQTPDWLNSPEWLQTPSWMRPPEWLHVNPTQWEAVIEFDGLRRQTENSGEFSENELEEGIRLRQSGYAWDPRIATFSSEFQPVFKQTAESGSGRREKRFGKFARANGNLSLLHGTASPVSVNIQALRDTGTVDGDLGSRTDFDTLIGSAIVNYKTPYFPSSLKYSERRQAQTFRSGFDTATNERNDILRSLNFRGRSSKMELLLQHDRFDDLVEGQNQDFYSNRATLSNNFRWGKGSRWNSRVDYFDRARFNVQERFTLDERVNIQHAEELSSTTSYNLSSQTQQQTTVTQTGSFALNHRLYQNLNTNFNASGVLVDSATTEEKLYQADLNLDYRKKIPWNGTFSTGLGGGYGVIDRQSTGGLTEAVDESHVVPSDRIVTLNSELIDTSSIIVTNAAGDLVYSVGSDYTVVAVENNLTELRIVAGGQINVGDTILVDYRFEAAPSQKFSRVPLRARVGLDFDWISVFHRESRLSEDIISGVGQDLLKEQRQRTSGIELKWISPATRATFKAEKRFDSLGDYKVGAVSFNQSLIQNVTSETSLSLTASQDFRKSGGLRTEFYSADASVSWQPLPNLSVRPRVGFWTRKQEEQDSEKFITGGFDLRWFWRKIDVRLRYSHDRNTVNNSETVEDRMLLTFTRGFQ